MSIRDLDKFIASLWDWGFLEGCFGQTKTRVGDIDGIIEHAGEVLLLEGKPFSKAPAVGDIWGPAHQAWNGQARLWRGLVGRGVSVLVLWGDAPDRDEPMKKVPAYMQLWRRFKDTPDPVEEASIELVRQRVKRWWKWAENASKDAA